MTALLDRVEIHEAGPHFIISGNDEESVRDVVDGLAREGVVVTVPGRIGNRWIASFEHPDLRRCKTTRTANQLLLTGPTPAILRMYSQQYLDCGWSIELEPYELAPGRFEMALGDKRP